MPRQPRENQNEVNVYHIMVQGINKEYIFNNEKAINKYLTLMKKNSEEYAIKIIAYCIMNNHVHLLVYSEEVQKISKMMQKINTAYAKYYNDCNERVGYVFRDRYLSQPIKTQIQLINCVKYIHDNPVKAKMVKDASEYKFSNYIDFYSKENLGMLRNLIDIDFEQVGEIEPYIEGEFIETEVDIKERILGCIARFCRQKGIRVSEILEDRSVLKELIRELKINYQIKYTEIMEIMNIPRGVMEKIKD